MLVTFTIKDGQKPTPEELAEIREAAKREIQFDEDAPELSPAMYKAFRCSVMQRNRRMRERPLSQPLRADSSPQIGGAKGDGE